VDLFRLAADAFQALLSTCLKTIEENQMKRQRVPYARRSVWTVIAILGVVIVAGCVAAGYEIHHLQSQVNGLQDQVNGLQLIIKQVAKEQLAKPGN
jgi:outer membrane murein-binding lipoprotein Lpp